MTDKQAPLAFLDTETTGLDPERHEIWEIGLIIRYREGPRAGEEDEYLWQLPVDLSRADPIALNIGRFHERRWHTPDVAVSSDDGLTGRVVVPWGNLPVWARSFVALTRGCHLVGNVVSFDAERLWKLLRRQGQCPMWHYHLIDVECLAAGWLAAGHTRPPEPGDKCTPPWDSKELSAALGVTVAEEDRHTALGDARWARDVYDVVMGLEPSYAG